MTLPIHDQLKWAGSAPAGSLKQQPGAGMAVVKFSCWHSEPQQVVSYIDDRAVAQCIWLAASKEFLRVVHVGQPRLALTLQVRDRTSVGTPAAATFNVLLPKTVGLWAYADSSELFNSAPLTGVSVTALVQAFMYVLLCRMHVCLFLTCLCEPGSSCELQPWQSWAEAVRAHVCASLVASLDSGHAAIVINQAHTCQPAVDHCHACSDHCHACS